MQPQRTLKPNSMKKVCRVNLWWFITSVYCGFSKSQGSTSVRIRCEQVSVDTMNSIVYDLLASTTSLGSMCDRNVKKNSDRTRKPRKSNRTDISNFSTLFIATFGDSLKCHWCDWDSYICTADNSLVFVHGEFTGNWSVLHWSILPLIGVFYIRVLFTLEACYIGVF